MLPQCVALLAAHHEKVEVVLSASWNLRRIDRRACQGACIHASMLPPLTVPDRYILEFRAKNRSLDGIETCICSNHRVLIFDRTAVITQKPDHADLLRIISGHCSGLAVRTEVFPRIEAEASQAPRTTYFGTVALGPMGLTSIFNDCNAVQNRKLFQFLHCHGMTIQVHGND